MNSIKNGLVTGLILQLAIGPVFFYIVNLVIQKTIIDGLVAVVAVTLVDYLYITLAIVGVGKLLEKQKIKTVFSVISSIVLMIFGLIIIKQMLGESIATTVAIHSTNLLSSFITSFLLAISSPMAIVWNTSLFTAKAIEYHYSKRELWIFGIATGSATLLFMGTAVIVFSLLSVTVPVLLIQLLNLLVGVVLVGYGGIRLIKILRS